MQLCVWVVSDVWLQTSEDNTLPCLSCRATLGHHIRITHRDPDNPTCKTSPLRTQRVAVSLSILSWNRSVWWCRSSGPRTCHCQSGSQTGITEDSLSISVSPLTSPVARAHAALLQLYWAHFSSAGPTITGPSPAPGGGRLSGVDGEVRWLGQVHRQW